MSVTTCDLQTLDEVIRQLDASGREHPKAAIAGEPDICQRRRARHPFRADCTAWFMVPGALTVTSLPGRTRNLSKAGLSCLLKRMFAKGDAIELEVEVVGRPRLFMAGLVRFCRYASKGYYEVGVSLEAAGPSPIFSTNPALAHRTLDWLRGVRIGG